MKACRPSSPNRDPAPGKLDGNYLFALLQVPTNTFYQRVDPADTPQPFNREHVMELLPLDLRPFVELHDFDEAFESYPFLGAMDDPKYPQCGSRPSVH